MIESQLKDKTVGITQNIEHLLLTLCFEFQLRENKEDKKYWQQNKTLMPASQCPLRHQSRYHERWVHRLGWQRLSRFAGKLVQTDSCF
jgi:hypothetical protein